VYARPGWPHHSFYWGFGRGVQNDRRQYITGIETAWYGIEKALNNSTPEQQAYEQLGEAERFVGRIASSNNITYDLKAEARVAELHMPMYRNRVNDCLPR